MSMSLPTPPRTTYKNKENLPPTPFTPPTSTCRTPRIIWSRENLHHAYSTQVRQLPSSSHAKGPQKSILKKPSLPLMSLIPPEEPAREVTPEPADPLQHPLYLNSPVSTLVASLKLGSDAKITLADLTEAYSVLSARLKTKMPTMVEMYGPIPALEPLRDHRDELVKTFHRDIGRAFVNPQSSPPPPHDDSPWSTPSSVGSIKKRGYTEHEVKHARDLCNLCHAAMRCFSNIALVPVLSSIFYDSQLADMLTDVLAIPLASSLPTPNARKTCQIAVWTIQTQRLPTAVLEPAADRIAYALRRGIDGELGREGKKGSASDGLKAVATLVLNQPVIFLGPFSEIIPSVFSHLTSQNLALRLQAAHTILSLSHALARLPSPPPVLLGSFRQATSAYLTSQQNMRKSAGDLSSLGKEFRACFENETPMHPAQSPMWALSVIAAFIVLSEGSAFTHPKTIRFVLENLRMALGVERKTVRATAGLVWRSLVWACVRLDDSAQSQEHKDAGWKVVRQVLDGSIGISVVAALARPKQQGTRVTQALEAVRTMIKKGGKTCEEGVDVFERLLSAVGSGLEEDQQGMWSNNKLLVEPFFDGTILKAEWKGLVVPVKDALNRCVATSDVTPLQEAEVVRHWDTLFIIWKEAIERAPLGEDGELPTALLNAWQALLLAQAQVTQGFEHLTTPPTFILRLTELLASFLNDPSLEWSLDASAPSWSSQPLKLGFVRNLWTVARNIFAATTLAGAAQTLLYEVLRHKYHLVRDEVRDAWAALCAELVLAGLPGLVKELWSEKGQDLDTEVKRGLWRVVSKRWNDDAGSWDGAIELLRAPFTPSMSWKFDKKDLDIWVRLVECALFKAYARKVSNAEVLDGIALAIGGGHTHVSLCKALPYLLSRVALSPEHQQLPQHPPTLLKVTNDVLVASYPPSDLEDKRMLLAIIKSLRDIIGVTRKEHLVDFLACVQQGVRVWILDEREVFTEEEYNKQVIPFYVDSLEALEKLPATIDMLYTLCPLLISAFNRIPDPALGPSTFKTFWIEMYKPLVPLSTHLPEDLKPVLRAVHDTMCTAEEGFALGLSVETQTQDLATMELPLSIIPDSLQKNEPAVEGSNGDIDRLLVPASASGQAKTTQEKGHVSSDGPPSPVMYQSTDGILVSELLQDRSPDIPHKESIRDDQSQDAPTKVSSHSIENPPVLLSGPDNTLPLDSTSVQDTSAPFIPPSADPGPSNTASDSVYQSIGLGNSPLSSLSDYDPFIVEDTNPFQNLTSSRVALRSPRPIKKEYSDIDPDTAMMLRSSQDSILSQQSKSNSSLGKRRRPHFSSHSFKKRKTAPGIGVEIINVSDDEDSEQVALDLSIIVAPVKHTKSLETRVLTQQADPPVTPTESQPSGKTSSRKKRTFFEAVELPTLQELLKERSTSTSLKPSKAPCERKAITRTRLASRLLQKESADMAEQPGPSKRPRIVDPFGKGKGRAVEDWGEESPQHSAFFGPLGSLEICSDDPDMHLTPGQPSDSSIPSSQPGQISASHIVSPILCRSRSEAYDIPSDDHMSSSPLKQVAARRIQRARTVPVLATNARLELSEMPTRPTMTRMHSEEFLALEHAHVVVSSGASRMGLQELVEANHMVSTLSTVLDDEMTKKIAVDEEQRELL